MNNQPIGDAGIAQMQQNAATVNSVFDTAGETIAITILATFVVVLLASFVCLGIVVRNLLSSRKQI